jgi:hypothetical protein
MTKMKMTFGIRKMRKVEAEEEFTSADPKRRGEGGRFLALALAWGLHS